MGLRGYGQLDPLIEFKKEAHELYREMLVEVRASVLVQLLDLLADYKAWIKIVYVEVVPAQLERQNRGRATCRPLNSSAAFRTRATVWR